MKTNKKTQKSTQTGAFCVLFFKLCTSKMLTWWNFGFSNYEFALEIYIILWYIIINKEIIKKRLTQMRNNAIISYRQTDRQTDRQTEANSVIFAYNKIVKFAI